MPLCTKTESKKNTYLSKEVVPINDVSVGCAHLSHH